MAACLKQAVIYFSGGRDFYRTCPIFHMKNMDGLLASNASHSMTILQLVEYYYRKKPKMKYRSIYIVPNQHHGIII